MDQSKYRSYSVYLSGYYIMCSSSNCSKIIETGGERMNKKTSLKVIQEIGSIGVKQYSDKWPPPCMGILHQPVRPQSSKKTNNKVY